MTTESKETRTIVLLANVDKVGSAGDRKRVDPRQAKALIEKSKARYATKADFDLSRA